MSGIMMHIKHLLEHDDIAVELLEDDTIEVIADDRVYQIQCISEDLIS